MDLFPSTPNLDVLLGRQVTVQMMTAAGGLQGLATLNGMKIRTLGLAAKKAEAAAMSGSIGSSGNGPTSSSSENKKDALSVNSLAKEAEKVVGGFIIDSTFLATLFDGDVAAAVSSEPLVVRKAVDVLGNKCALAARTDLSGTRRDGSYGKEVAEEVKLLVETAREKGKVDAGHIKALDAVETREDRKKRAGKQVRNADKRDRIEEEESIDAVSFILAKYMATTTMADLGLSREEREERLLKMDEVKSAIVLEEARRKERHDRRLEQQNQGNDMAAAGTKAYESLFCRSSGYLQRTFGTCRARFDTEAAAYAKLAAATL